MLLRGYSEDDLWKYNYAAPRILCRLSMREGMILYKFLWSVKGGRIRIDKYNVKIKAREWSYFHDIEQRLANEITYQMAFNGSLK